MPRLNLETSTCLSLGIDAGGTFTDAVLFDQGERRVLASAKAFTTYQDLSIGILDSVRKALSAFGARFTPPLTIPEAANRIKLVGLSSTLATNALVEGRGGRVALLLIGYDPSLLESYGLIEELGTKDFRYLRGGHTAEGTEQCPLDEEEVQRAVLHYLPSVDAFAVSGYFSVRNPAHELRVKRIIQELSARESARVPVTCGHELTSRLDSVRRAMTTVMNARLIPLLEDLMGKVRSSLQRVGIDAPLMVVRGDGSLARAEWIAERPIETILSGPAASVVGAQVLSGAATFWAVDMGGTTTDIAHVRDGLPARDTEGAQVGRWKTMVEAIALRTIGLGGDSRVRFPDIGPDRVVPLCVLVHWFPPLIEELKRQLEGETREDLLGRFLLLRIDPREGLSRKDLSERERLLVDLLGSGPQSLDTLSKHERLSYTLERNVRRLLEFGIAIECGFTPTDALHALGEMNCWNQEASRLGATLLSRKTGVPAETLCRRIREEVSFRVAEQIAWQAIFPKDPPQGKQSESDPYLLHTALRSALEPKTSSAEDGNSGEGGQRLFDCAFSLKDPIVAVGAPVAAYLPEAGQRLHAPCLIPPHAEVANAVGAVAGWVVERGRAEIHPVQVEGALVYRAHTALGIWDYPDLEGCIEKITSILQAQVLEKAREAGAEHAEARLERRDIRGSSAGQSEDIFLKTVLEVTAFGRPALGNQPSVAGPSKPDTLRPFNNL